MADTTNLPTSRPLTRQEVRALSTRLAAHEHARIAALTDDPEERLHLADLVRTIVDHLPPACNHTTDALRIVLELAELGQTYAEDARLLTTH